MTLAPIEHDGALPDGWPCKLSISDQTFVLEIADNRLETRRQMMDLAVADPLIVRLANGQTATLSENYNAKFSAQTTPESVLVKTSNWGEQGLNRASHVRYDRCRQLHPIPHNE
jgi:hypothetical protein